MKKSAAIKFIVYTLLIANIVIIFLKFRELINFFNIYGIIIGFAGLISSVVGKMSSVNLDGTKVKSVSRPSNILLTVSILNILSLLLPFIALGLFFGFARNCAIHGGC